MVSQKVTQKRESVYEKRKKKKRKKKEKKSRVSSNRANTDANIPTVSDIKTTPKKRQQK
jgi:orotate phosphoribosyltransferase-like protein